MQDITIFNETVVLKNNFYFDFNLFVSANLNRPQKKDVNLWKYSYRELANEKV